MQHKHQIDQMTLNGTNIWPRDAFKVEEDRVNSINIHKREDSQTYAYLRLKIIKLDGYVPLGNVTSYKFGGKDIWIEYAILSGKLSCYLDGHFDGLVTLNIDDVGGPYMYPIRLVPIFAEDKKKDEPLVAAKKEGGSESTILSFIPKVSLFGPDKSAAAKEQPAKESVDNIADKKTLQPHDRALIQLVAPPVIDMESVVNFIKAAQEADKPALELFYDNNKEFNEHSALMHKLLLENPRVLDFGWTDKNEIYAAGTMLNELSRACFNSTICNDYSYNKLAKKYNFPCIALSDEYRTFRGRVFRRVTDLKGIASAETTQVLSGR